VSLTNSLINLLEQDSSEKVQATVATALGKFVMLAEHIKLHHFRISRVYQTLLTTISDKGKPVEVRRRVLEAAAPLSLPQVRKAIIEAYRSHNSKLKISAYAMDKSCDYFWLSILLKELASADAEIRYQAVGACSKLGEVKMAPYFIELQLSKR
jgi:hypothetical protein